MFYHPCTLYSIHACHLIVLHDTATSSPSWPKWQLAIAMSHTPDQEHHGPAFSPVCKPLLYVDRWGQGLPGLMPHIWCIHDVNVCVMLSIAGEACPTCSIRKLSITIAWCRAPTNGSTACGVHDLWLSTPAPMVTQCQASNNSPPWQNSPSRQMLCLQGGIQCRPTPS